MNKYFIFVLIALLIIVYKIGDDSSETTNAKLVNETNEKGSPIILAKPLTLSTEVLVSQHQTNILESSVFNDTEVSAHIISEEGFTEKSQVIDLDDFVGDVTISLSEPPVDYAKEIPLEMLSVNQIKIEDMIEYNHNITLEEMTEVVDESAYGNMFTKDTSVLLYDMIDHSLDSNLE